MAEGMWIRRKGRQRNGQDAMEGKEHAGNWGEESGEEQDPASDDEKSGPPSPSTQVKPASESGTALPEC